jgi:hypothetical protein
MEIPAGVLLPGYRHTDEVAYSYWVAILQYAEPVLIAWQVTPQGTHSDEGIAVTNSTIVNIILSDRVVHQDESRRTIESGVTSELVSVKMYSYLSRVPDI